MLELLNNLEYNPALSNMDIQLLALSRLSWAVFIRNAGLKEPEVLQSVGLS